MRNNFKLQTKSLWWALY